MISGLIISIIWCIAGAACLFYILYRCVALLYKAAKVRKEADEYAKEVKARTDAKYNKYIAMSPDELERTLARIFSCQLELISATKISEQDSEAFSKLYLDAVAKVLAYIGPESLAAIDYYYGEDYVMRWCEMRFKILENRGMLTGVVSKSKYADSIYPELVMETEKQKSGDR